MPINTVDAAVGSNARKLNGPLQFPVPNFADAIALASTSIDVVLATLGDVVPSFGQEGDNGLIKGVVAVIGGDQDGYYHSLPGKLRSALPFLTASTQEFAFSVLN